jgi:hypothetical protein
LCKCIIIGSHLGRKDGHLVVLPRFAAEKMDAANVCCYDRKKELMSVYLDVAYILHIFCKCFIWVLRMCCNSFSSVSYVFLSVSDICFKRFICLQTYITSIVIGCFKSRSSVASPSSSFAVSPWCLLAFYSTDWGRGM